MGILQDRAVWTAETFGAELIEMTIGDMLDRQARDRPGQMAVIFDDAEEQLDIRWTYAALKAAADRLAKGLIAQGVAAGEHVAVLAPNLPEWVLLEMALAKVGAVLVTVNTAYRRAELEYLLRQGDVVTLVMVETYRGNSFLDALRDLVPALAAHDPSRGPLAAPQFPKLARVVVIGTARPPGCVTFDDVLQAGAAVADAALADRQRAVSPFDVAQIQYTSGTTGFPKGVMLSHHSTLNNANLIAQRAGFGPQDRLVSSMPLFHTAGCVCNVLTMLCAGGTFVACPFFDAAKMLRLVAQHGGTVVNAVPTMWLRMLQDPGFVAGAFDVSSLAVAWAGGTTISTALMEEVKAKMGAEAMVIFGMTETSPIISQTLPTDTLERRTTTAGVPMPFTDVKIVDAAGAPVGFDETGELCVRGYLLMQGYYNMPERTRETIDAEGWLHSGDLAAMSADGAIRIVGRSKDMIIRGGENIYPAEIEEFLLRHPQIAQAQVVGVPDPDLGEEAMAILQSAAEELSEADVRAYCRANISRHKMPKYIRFVATYPLTASGKIKKFELREWAQAEVAKEGVPS